MPELIWEGKARGVEARRELAGEPLALRTVARFGGKKGWQNRLIRGDQRWVLPALSSEFRGAVDLIYIDPPFDTGGSFSFKTRLPGRRAADGASSVVSERAYRDRWGLDRYLAWFAPLVASLRELLSERGTLYVHLDWRAVHYAKVVLDEVFGVDCFRSEIIWRYRRWPAPTPNLQRMHDTILAYARGPKSVPIFHTLYEPLAPSTRQTFGTRRQVADFSSGRRKPAQLDEPSPGAPLADVWDIGVIAPSGHERVGYPTQKPVALLERIVRLSSDEDSLVLDCFSGSGTTALVAERLGRRWIAADIGRLAVHTTRRRLLASGEPRPFLLQDLGAPERRAWQAASFGAISGTSDPEAATRAWLLARFGARPVEGGSWLHGRKGKRPVHVGAVAHAVSPDELVAIAQAAHAAQQASARGTRRASARGAKTVRPEVDVLGWEFTPAAVARCHAIGDEAGVTLRLFTVPHEALAVGPDAPGELSSDDFLALEAPSVKVAGKGREVSVELTDVRAPGHLTAEARRALKDGSEWIESWAVDWDYRGEAFVARWHASRARGEASLPLRAAHTYSRAGAFTIAVKVTDLLGHEVTTVVERKVR